MGITKRNDGLPVNIFLEGSQLKQTDKFKYLGSILTEDGRCEAEIKTRIAIGKSNFGKMRNVLANLSLSTELRVRLLKAYIWSGMLYGCECWTINAAMRKKLEAAEMWLLRRMMRVPWTARRTNQEVLQMAGVTRTLMTTIRQRQLRYIGHVMRGRDLGKDCLLGMIEGTRARGRQRMKYMDGLKALVGCDGIGEMIRMAEDRARWKIIVANVKIDTALR